MGKKRSSADQGAPGINSASIESFVIRINLGQRIKRLRLSESMGLSELSARTGLSSSFHSQMETGRIIPTLRNLARIALVFQKDLSYFLEPEQQATFKLQRRQDRTRLPQTGAVDPAYFFENLGGMVPDRPFNPYYAEFLPHRRSDEVRTHAHPGIEILYILDGTLELRHAEKVEVLEPGDSVYFDASRPHSYLCNGEIPAKVLIVTMRQSQEILKMAG